MKIRRIGTIAPAVLYLALTAVMAASLAGCGGTSSVDTSSDGLLPRNYVDLLKLVSHYFNTITQQENTGKDSTAQGNPTATRAMFFINDDGSQLVMITVDRCRNASDASSAYQTAVQKSEEVPGF